MPANYRDATGVRRRVVLGTLVIRIMDEMLHSHLLPKQFTWKSQPYQPAQQTDQRKFFSTYTNTIKAIHGIIVRIGFHDATLLEVKPEIQRIIHNATARAKRGTKGTGRRSSVAKYRRTKAELEAAKLDAVAASKDLHHASSSKKIKDEVDEDDVLSHISVTDADSDNDSRTQPYGIRSYLSNEITFARKLSSSEDDQPSEEEPRKKRRVQTKKY